MSSFTLPVGAVEIAPMHRDGLRVDLHSGSSLPRTRVVLWSAASDVKGTGTQRFVCVPSSQPVSAEEQQLLGGDAVAIAAVHFLLANSASPLALDAVTPAGSPAAASAVPLQQCHVMPFHACEGSTQRFLLVERVAKKKRDDDAGASDVRCFSVIVPPTPASASGPLSCWTVNRGRGMGAELVVAPMLRSGGGGDVDDESDAHQRFRFIQQPPQQRVQSAALSASQVAATGGGAHLPADGDVVEIVAKWRPMSGGGPELRLDFAGQSVVRGAKAMLWQKTAPEPGAAAQQQQNRSQRFRVHYCADAAASEVPSVRFAPVVSPRASLEMLIDGGGGGAAARCVVADTDPSGSPRQMFALVPRVVGQSEADGRPCGCYFQIINAATGAALTVDAARGLGADLLAAVPDPALETQLFRLDVAVASAAAAASAVEQADVVVGVPIVRGPPPPQGYAVPVGHVIDVAE